MTEPHVDMRVYPRLMVDEGKIREYADLMRDSGWGAFPPIKVGRTSGIIYDGVHRFQAAQAVEIQPQIEWVDDPIDDIERLELGARLNRHGKPLDSNDRRTVLKRCWESHVNSDRAASIAGTTKYWGRYYYEQFEAEKVEAANKAALATNQDTPEIKEAKKMLDKGEEIVASGHEIMYRGSYAADTPRDKVEYRKNPDGATIDYASVRVEGQDAADLVIDLRRILRRVAWVKEAAIFHHLTLEDVSLFTEGASVLSRAATARKSGSAPVTVIEAKFPQEQPNFV